MKLYLKKKEKNNFLSKKMIFIHSNNQKKILKVKNQFKLKNQNKLKIKKEWNILD